MFPEVNPENLILETKRYEYRDGLRDILSGLSFILVGFFFWFLLQPIWFDFLLAFKAKSQTTPQIWLFVLLAFLLLLVYGLNRLLDTLRRRWLWRDSGFAKPLSQVFPGRFTPLINLIYLPLLFLGIYLHYLPQTHPLFLFNWLMALGGWHLGASLIWLGKHIQLTRYIWIGSIGLLPSTAFLFIELPLDLISLSFFLIWGTLYLLSGGFAFARFRLTPKERPNVG